MAKKPKLPAPPVPADLNLKDYPRMPLDVGAMLTSPLMVRGSGEALRAAMALWLHSWHQIPAASLPDDDDQLAFMAGFGVDVQAWLEIKSKAMRKFYKASDGRLYHPVIAAKALKIKEDKELRATAGRAGAAARWGDAAAMKKDGNAKVLPMADGMRLPSKNMANKEVNKIQVEVVRATPSLPQRGRARVLPDDWEPTEETIHAIHRELGCTRPEIERMVREMRDWSKSQGKARVDWDATLRNWARSPIRQQQRTANGPGRRKTNADIAREAFDLIDLAANRAGEKGGDENP